jgi:hypothetical protein
MKVVGGPRDGEDITVRDGDGVEFMLNGAVFEYDVRTPGKTGRRLTLGTQPQPSVPGEFERYQFREDAWHYVPPIGP